VLHATVGGFGSLAQRPVIVEDSPYAPDVSTLDWVGADFNFVELQLQGTGLSQGSLDAMGPADQSVVTSSARTNRREGWLRSSRR
jgi:hypothetical protein